MIRYEAETLDLSRVGAPSLVPVDFAATLAERLEHFRVLWDEERKSRPELPAFDTLMIESEPARLLTREYAFGDTLLKQAINDIANSLRLATSIGADLDHVAKTYHNTQRLVLDAGDPTTVPPRPPLYESDDEYRARSQLAPEAYPMFGLVPGGYIWRVRRQFGGQVKGVRALKRPGGHIDLMILARAGDGTSPAELIGTIQAGFEGEDASQCTDIVTVLPARIVATPVEVVLLVPPGPDTAPLIEKARANVNDLAAERHAIGETLHVQAIGAAAKVGPVRAVRVVAPVADIEGGPDGAPFVSSIIVRTEIDR